MAEGVRLAVRVARMNRASEVRERAGDQDRRTRVLVPGLLLILFGAMACAGSGATAPTKTRATTEASSVPASSAPPSASPAPSEPVGERYTTTAFAVSLTVIVEPLLKSPPMADTTNLLTWDAAADANEKIRFLIPAEVYPPRRGVPRPPPADYLAYLLRQARSGATFSDESTISVGGHTATLMTATTTTSLDASLGCPIAGVANPEYGGVGECFGLQPGISARIAVIDLGDGTTLVAWARTGIDAPDDEFDAMFERMLESLQFN